MASRSRASDPVEIVVPIQTRVARRSGLDIRRSNLDPSERVPWSGIGLATPLRMSLDLLLDRELPDAVADLDAVLRAGLVDRDELSHGRSHACGFIWCSTVSSRCRSSRSVPGIGLSHGSTWASRPAGWEVLFVTARQLRDPHSVVAAVRTALTSRSR